mgnify:CR=1 FL=1
MKIKKLIKVFETLLPIYENIPYTLIHNGLCYNAKVYCGTTDLYDIFCRRGYYGNFVKCCCLPFYFDRTKGTPYRIEFMKNEIKELKKLLKEGYTDI